MPDATVSAAGMRIMRLLVGQPPRTVAELIDASGVTRTAVSEQLNDLESAGFVRRGTERQPGRGRPCHVYSATRAAMIALFADQHHRVVPAVWKAIRDFGGEALVEEIVRRVSRDLVRHYKPRVTAANPRKRLTKFAQLLRDEGVLVEVSEEHGHVVMRKRSCPFMAMCDDSRLICCIDEAVTAEIVGSAVRRTSSRHDEAPCCTFEVDGAP